MAKVDDIVKRFEERNAKALEKNVGESIRHEEQEHFADTKQVVKIGGKERPVMRLGERIYAGHTLGPLNPSGAGGSVWSARSNLVQDLQDNIIFTETYRANRKRNRPEDAQATED